jgi:RNA-binding protein
MEKKKARELGHRLDPIIRIGKSGLTDQVIDEIKKHIKKRNLIKVKLLRAYISTKDKKEIFKEIAERTGSELVNSIGFVVVLAKKGYVK